MRSTRPRRQRPAGVATAVALAAGVLAGNTVPALAVTSVTTASGAVWQIHDATRPGLDTGSIRALSGSRVDGYGNIFVRVDGSTARMNGQMVRGFGLTTTDGGASFDTTRSVELGGVLVTRDLDLSASDDLARYFDSFTNVTDAPLTVEVSFGGALGYGWGDQQGAIRATSSGDTTIGTDDAWTIAAQPTTDQRPIGTVLGSPAPFAGAMTSVGNQERDPFETPYVTTGQEANFYGYVNTVTIPAGETRSLLRFVQAGPVGGTEAQDAVRASLDGLAAAPDLGGLAVDEVCSIANWDLDTTGCAPAVRLDVPGAPAAQPTTTTVAYDVTNKSIQQLQADMQAGVTTSEQITQAYLDRIAAYDEGQFGFNAFITVASDALDQARAADAARAAGTTGDLLGIPMAIKDLYDTYDMPTTGGTAALEGYQPDSDAFQVARLREAGAVILGKANMSELAISGNYSESGYGQVWNALSPSKTSFGSSGGSAVAVATSMAAAAMGSQTGNSLWGPTSGSSLTMFRGTDGMESLSGVMPLSWGPDYAGPIARSVSDLASILNAVSGTDPADDLTTDADVHRPADWTSVLDPSALQGVRVGYLPASFQSQFTDDGTGAALVDSFDELEAAGATMVEMTARPAVPVNPVSDTWAKGVGEGWERYLASRTNFPFPDANALYADSRMLPYNRGTLSTTGGFTDAEATQLREYRHQYREQIAQWMDDNGVDVLVYPGYISDVYNNDGNTVQHSSDRNTGIITSETGLPTVMVPVGANPHGYSMSLQLVGREWQDASVLSMAYALEQQAQGQQVTPFAPALQVVAAPDPDPTSEPQPTDPGTTPADPTPPTVTDAVATDPAPGADRDASASTGASTSRGGGRLAATGADGTWIWLSSAGVLLAAGSVLAGTAYRRRHSPS